MLSLRYTAESLPRLRCELKGEPHHEVVVDRASVPHVPSSGAAFAGRVARGLAVARRSDTLRSLPLEPDMARRLRANARSRSKVIDERDALILEAADAGAGLREIAREVGMSHVGVRDIVSRQRAGREDSWEDDR